jgi:phosphoribosylanthranilate isomerase
MKIKVCGMKYPNNIDAVVESQPDFIGFIFYEKSKRYIDNELEISQIATNETIKKIGVFVNSPIQKVIETAKKHNLDFVQLHGEESIDYVKELHAKKVKIIKAFQITKNFNWEEITQFVDYSSCFLFDTASSNYGGSGLKFEWNQLKNYKERLPFFLSGGISIEDYQKIKELTLPRLYGIDINSKFESSPGVKDIDLVRTMIKLIKNEPTLSSK